jgi:hypothetical protein
MSDIQRTLEAAARGTPGFAVPRFDVSLARANEYLQFKVTSSPGNQLGSPRAITNEDREEGEMPDNAILASLDTDGCSDATAAPEQVEPGTGGSRKIAQHDLARVNALRARFEAAAVQTDLPAALLAAVASRETHCGALLDQNGEGDHGFAFGIMQVDKRFHQQAGRPDPRSQEHIDQAAGILKDYAHAVAAKFPDAAPEDCLLAAIAAYNCGVGGVHSIETPDDSTTHGDYSSDTWVRAQFFAEQWAVAS